MKPILGVDTGGTFTDFVFWQNGHFHVHKVLSTPQAPEVAILQGTKDLNINLQDLLIVHGTTVATNAVLQSQGAKTVFITNRGFKDIINIGRQTRAHLYDIMPNKSPPFIDPELCLETGGRLGADGKLLDPLTDEDLSELEKALEQLAPQSVAICLLFAFLDSEYEQAIESRLKDRYFVSRSSYVHPEYKEYERAIATVLNARVAPIIRDYLTNLSCQVTPARVEVMQSSGETIDATRAAELAVNLLLSGPAGGLIAANTIGERIGKRKLLTFDMGGTSTDVALIDGEICITKEGRLGSLPLTLPMVDMHTIGAGGGSIAFIDEGGALQVGPASAGADPGPACYGLGGTQPTVTDANLVLQRIPVGQPLGGTLHLSEQAASTAIETIAAKLECSRHAAAQGIIDITNQHIIRALEQISLQRGIDPAEFTLVCFGGAGGLHLCELAERLCIEQALVPRYSGLFSAFGMLCAPMGRTLSHTVGGILTEYTDNQIESLFDALKAEALKQIGSPETEAQVKRFLELRYLGQSYCLEIPWHNIATAETLFHHNHAQYFGHRLTTTVELVNIRLTAHHTRHLPQLPVERSTSKEIKCDHIKENTTIIAREALEPGRKYSGELIILEEHATTLVTANWFVTKDQEGHLHLQQKTTTHS
ncbi:MAG TPA: hydantoinase [Gammaproteobacteria bacterium]|nr:hydantoinase [Gammaproteobacteria bacterium]